MFGPISSADVNASEKRQAEGGQEVDIVFGFHILRQREYLYYRFRTTGLRLKADE